MKKILIVDDDPLVLSTFQHSFNDEELKSIDFASTGDEAVNLLRKNKYDKVICDLRLNGNFDGFQVLRVAREQGVKVRVLLTAVSSPIEVGGTSATYAFRKPCDSQCVRNWVLTDVFDSKKMAAAYF